MPEYTAFVRQNFELFFHKKRIVVGRGCIVINSGDTWKRAVTRTHPETFEITSRFASIRFLSSADFKRATELLRAQPVALVAYL